MLVLFRFAHGQVEESRFIADLRQLAAPVSRSIGTEGYYQTARWLEDEIRRLPDVELQVHEFPVVVPVMKSATLTFEDGSSQSVHPFWPAGARVCSTPPEGIHGQLIYCGEARIDQIPIARIADQIAVVESTARTAWTRLFSSGARAIIVLGSAEMNHVDLRSHDIRIPINLPRFYVSPGQFADRLRDSKFSGRATLRACVTWESRSARNLYALIKPAKSDPAHRAALMIYAPFDSTSLVPDLAPGASQAVQTASALAMLRDFSRAPPDRPILFCFSGADAIQLLGSRQMLLALAEAPRTWWSEMSALSIKQSDAYQARYRASEIRGYPGSLDARRDRSLMDRMIRIVELDVKVIQDELFRLRAQSRDTGAIERDQALAWRSLSALRSKPADVPRELVDRTIAHLDTLLDQYAARKGLLDRRVELYQWLARRIGRNAGPEEDDSADRLIEVVIGIDLSDGGRRVGPMVEGQFQRATSIADVQDYLTWLNRAARAPRFGSQTSMNWFDLVRHVVDLEPPDQIRATASYLCGNLPISTELCQAWGVPGLSLVTLDDQRLRRDTPADTIDRIDVRAILPQLRAVQTILTRAANDPAFAGPADRKRRRTNIPGQVVSLAPGKPVPNLGREGFLIAYQYVATVVSAYPKLRPMPWTLGVRRNEMIACDADGNYLIEGLPRLNNDLQLFAITANRIDETGGAITATTDLGKQTGDIKIYRDIKLAGATPVQSLVFDCEEVALTDVIDPRFLQPLNELTLIDARKEAEPQRFNYYLHERLFAAFTDPGMRADYAFRYGRLGNRLLLRERDGEVASATVSDALPFQTAQDFWNLNHQRLANYRRANVSSALLDSMHDNSKSLLDDARRALSENHSTDFVRAAELAWANEARVYDAVRELADDVVRGAIFLLLLCVPFSFCMERLLIGTTNVYRQILGGATIFTIMLAALWSFHPAFKISASPLIVVLAFAIIFMSLVVIVVLYNRFNVELTRIRSGQTDQINLARVGVLSNAILLGIANMRRRKLRTVLTSITIVLITFAVLCFTSSQSYLDTIALPTGTSSDGRHEVLLRQRGFRPIPPDIVDSIAATIGSNATLIPRWWNVSSADPKDHIALLANAPSPRAREDGGGAGSAMDAPRVVAIRGLLGLSPDDDAIDPSAFARLQSDERDIIYLPTNLAMQLSVHPGDHILVGGIELQLAGTFDPDRFDQRARALSGEPISPLMYVRDGLDTGGRKLDDAAPESFEFSGGSGGGGGGGGGGGAEVHPEYEHLSSAEIAIVPAALSRYLPNASLRSISIKLRDHDDVKRTSDLLARRFALACFASYDDGVRMVTAGNLTRVSGVGAVAIPLVIAGLIVFNTMMGSIAERSREIHVYTSLGLAPLHVGALFLAEASVYGLIGAVFGYVIGQGAGTVFTRLGWLGDVTLNYSGTSAMFTMTLMLAIVLMSAIVPARLAAKIAAPSIERRWHVPEPVNGTITATLPFTINRAAADVAIAQLTDFFESHTDSSIGRFAADSVRPFQEKSVRGLTAEIWLAPFDLGLRQQLELSIKEGSFADIFEVQAHLTRLSGDDKSWWRANRRFLAELRKQLLQWRTVKG